MSADLTQQRLDCGDYDCNAPVRMWHFLRVRNIGDIVGPNVVSHCAGRPTIYSNNSSLPRLLSVGSIVGVADRNAVIWGSGLMDPDQTITQITGSNIYALRGKLTHTRLRQSGIAMADLPLGDPGYLAPALFNTNSPKLYRLGVIPHYVDQRHEVVRKLTAEDGVLNIDVRWSPERFFEALSSCEAVVSSSLHGLIFSEALSIPNLWLKLSDRVIRTGFKYRDWFSLSSRPQLEAYEPSSNDNADELIKQTMLHDCQIDSKELVEAFPHERLEEMSEIVSKTFVSLASSRIMPLPIFIISFNRGEFLLRAIASYRRLLRPVEIIIHDNGSDDAETVRVLNELENEGVKIYRHHSIDNPDELNCVNDTVSDYFSSWSEPSRYVVSDCDIDLNISSLDSLDVYDELLDCFTSAQCVGPMLSIRDVPPYYPLYHAMLNRHIEQFWHKRPQWTKLDAKQVAFQEAPVDTTFALHRAGEPFHRLKQGLRVYFPYEAQHMDWYLDAKSMLEKPYFLTASERVSHWAHSSSLAHAAADHLKFDHYYYVDRSATGELVELIESLERR